MKEKEKYDAFKHKQTALCWSIINIVLTISYIFEVIKSNRTIEYAAIFILVAWLPLVSFTICKNIIKVNDSLLEYSAGIGYLCFYVFAMITAQNKAVFCYIFPMLCILTVYSNKLLNNIVMMTSLIINMTSIAYDIIIRGQSSSTDITFDEIQFACMILCMIFLWRSSKILELRDNMISSLSNDAYYDVLTKINNRAYLDKLEEQYENEESYIKSLAIIDIDNFKQINDKFGHKSGDKALIWIADILNEATGTYGGATPIRLGGDEFIIVCDSQDMISLRKICEDIHNKVSNGTLLSEDGENMNITVSIGAMSGSRGQKFNDLYNVVDDALYQAKRCGKNRIVIVENA